MAKLTNPWECLYVLNESIGNWLLDRCPDRDRDVISLSEVQDDTPINKCFTMIQVGKLNRLLMLAGFDSIEHYVETCELADAEVGK